MAEHSRRAFIRGAGVSAAAATVAVMVPGVASAAPKSDDGGPTPDGAVVAYVTDAKAGSLTLMRGEREFQVTDKALARKLAKLATN